MSGDTGFIASSGASASGGSAPDDRAPDRPAPDGPGWMHAEPGPALADTLAQLDGASLDDHDLVEAIAAAERLIAWSTSLQLDLMADFARRPARVEIANEDPEVARAMRAPLGRRVREFADDELAVRLKTSRVSASARIDLGCALAGLPATRGALRGGRVDVARARVMVEETRALDRATAREVEAALIGSAERLPAARLRPKVRAGSIAVDPVAAEDRRVRAQAGRCVAITPAADGMADLWARLSAVDAQAIGEAIGASARASARAAATTPGSDDHRTMDQRRADALVAPFVEALATGELSGLRLASRRGRPAELQVTVAASTLLGLDDAPAQLRGYGAITAETARELAPDARWRRILTDPCSGTVLDVGTTVYRPPAGLARHVEVRDQLCGFPGCGWPADACDFDHVVPFPEGPTSADNGRPHCRRHHRFKQSRQVRVEQLDDGTTRWTLPTGHTYDSPRPAFDPAHPIEPTARDDDEPP